MRNDQDLCQTQLGNKRTENPYEIIHNWIRKGTDHFGIPLVDRGESRYQLENQKILLEGKGTKIFL